MSILSVKMYIFAIIITPFLKLLFTILSTSHSYDVYHTQNKSKNTNQGIEKQWIAVYAHMGMCTHI